MNIQVHLNLNDKRTHKKYLWNFIIHIPIIHFFTINLESKTYDEHVLDFRALFYDRHYNIILFIICYRDRIHGELFQTFSFVKFHCFFSFYRFLRYYSPLILSDTASLS